MKDLGQVSSRSAQLLVVHVHDENLLAAVQAAILEQIKIKDVSPYIEGQIGSPEISYYAGIYLVMVNSCFVLH